MDPDGEYKSGMKEDVSPSRLPFPVPKEDVSARKSSMNGTMVRLQARRPLRVSPRNILKTSKHGVELTRQPMNNTSAI